MKEIEKVITWRRLSSKRIAEQAQALGRAIADGKTTTESLVRTLDLCPACHQLLVTCLGCGRHRGAWKDPASRADYCSERCRARTKKRRHRARA